MARHKRKTPQNVDDRLRWLGAYVDGFRAWLIRCGYSPASITEIARLLACWAEWAPAVGFGVANIEDALVASARVFRGGKIERAPQGAAKLFVRYLQTEGVLSPEAAVPSPEQSWPVLAAYRRWMREQRGLAESTLDMRRAILIDFIEALGDDPAAYTAAAIRAFVLKRAAPHGRGRANGIASAIRSFLGYLIADGKCPAGLDRATPTFANWRLTTTPRFLSDSDVNRVIGACDAEDRLRDRAIVLLLARLGLRASEVAHLSFPDIDWDKASLVVLGKSRREDRLPLTQEVGDAILAYIERARPKTASLRVFQTEAAPIVPLGRAAIKCIVRRALGRAGVDSPHRGAHVLRHSAATAMLGAGVSLAGVGAVLRHRSPSMTAHYAKVDIALLSEIAQAWGGRQPC